MPSASIGSLDSAHPEKPEEFNEYAKLLVAKLNTMSSNPQFIPFFKNVCRDVFHNTKVDQLQELSSFFTVLVNEKLRKGKDNKKKHNSLCFYYLSSSIISMIFLSEQEKQKTEEEEEEDAYFYDEYDDYLPGEDYKAHGTRSEYNEFKSYKQYKGLK